ncbi:ribonuclease H-like domain-containing protein [Tanacetum coccineum]
MIVSGPIDQSVRRLNDARHRRGINNHELLVRLVGQLGFTPPTNVAQSTGSSTVTLPSANMVNSLVYHTHASPLPKFVASPPGFNAGLVGYSRPSLVYHTTQVQPVYYGSAPLGPSIEERAILFLEAQDRVKKGPFWAYQIPVPDPTPTANLNPFSIHPMVTRFHVRTNCPTRRYKARLVVYDSTLVVGIDVDETFSPVFKPDTIRTVLSLATSRHWPSHQLDVKNTFVHDDLSETVYMHEPPGFQDSTHPGYRKYAVEILERAYMVNCNPNRTAVDTESKLGDDGDLVSDLTLYRSLTGSL